MTAYFLRRLLLIIPTFIGITMMVFTITRFVPGGPIEQMIARAQMMSGDKMASKFSASGSGGQTLSEDQMLELKKYYGFDKPLHVSYVLWLKKVVTFDLGTSTRYNEPVWDMIKSKFHISLTYGIVDLFLIYLICIPLGIFKAIRHKSVIDNVSSVLVFVGYAIPSYVVAIAILIFFGGYLEWFPLGGFVSDNFDEFTTLGKLGDIIWHGVLPVTAYVSGSFAGMTFLMKNTMMDNLAADYVRTAIAKGLPFKKAVVRHALRNSLIPIATSFGHILSVLLTGSFLIEKIFNIDGMGLLGFESIVERDYPVVLGILVISSLLYMLGNILSDICVALVDPRVQFK